MSEMIERVARAIDEAMAKAPPGEIGLLVARAAIEAMREPTDDMRVPEAAKLIWRAMIDEALK